MMLFGAFLWVLSLIIIGLLVFTEQPLYNLVLGSIMIVAGFVVGAGALREGLRLRLEREFGEAPPPPSGGMEN